MVALPVMPAYTAISSIKHEHVSIEYLRGSITDTDTFAHPSDAIQERI